MIFKNTLLLTITTIAVCTTLRCVAAEPQPVLYGEKLSEFTRTSLTVKRTLAMEVNGQLEEKSIISPVLFRTGSVYLEPASIDKLAALRVKLAGFAKKIEELKKIAGDLQAEYDAIIASGRPNWGASESAN